MMIIVCLMDICCCVYDGRCEHSTGGRLLTKCFTDSSPSARCLPRFRVELDANADANQITGRATDPAGAMMSSQSSCKYEKCILNVYLLKLITINSTNILIFLSISGRQRNVAVQRRRASAKMNDNTSLESSNRRYVALTESLTSTAARGCRHRPLRHDDHVADGGKTRRRYFARKSTSQSCAPIQHLAVVLHASSS